MYDLKISNNFQGVTSSVDDEDLDSSRENKGLREWKHKHKPQADEDHRQAFII